MSLTEELKLTGGREEWKRVGSSDTGELPTRARAGCGQTGVPFQCLWLQGVVWDCATGVVDKRKISRIPTAGRDVYRGIYGFDMRLRPTYVSAERAEGLSPRRPAGAGLSIRRAVEQK